MDIERVIWNAIIILLIVYYNIEIILLNVILSWNINDNQIPNEINTNVENDTFLILNFICGYINLNLITISVFYSS